MAASESITFDFVSRGADRLAGDFKKTGDSAVLASRGAKVLADAIDKLGSKENRTAEESRLLAGALRKLGSEEDKAAAKALYADAAIRRLDDAMKNTSGIDKWTSKLSGLGFLQPSLKGSLFSLLPALIPVAANVGGAVAAISVSFGAATVAAAGFGAVAGSVLSQASQDLTKLQTLNRQLSSATTKSAKDKIRAQISALEAGWTPAFRKIMGDLEDLKTAWKTTSIAIAAPALLPWLDAVKKGLTFLKPLLSPVAAIFKSWGQSIDQYFSSGKGSAEITRLASAFGKFAALQLNDILLFLKGVGTAVFNLGRDIGASGTNFYTFGTDLAGWGIAFAKWSASKKARDEVAGFIHYIHNTGPKLVSIVKDLASYIPGIFSGATTAGTLELQALSTFLGWVAKLPPSWAKPITELAGAVLLLSKTGVIKVGIQLVGTAAKLISGGSLSLGGSTAASQIEAAFRTGGAAAAEEIRAAMAGVAAGSAEETAGASAGGGLLSRIFGGKPSVLGFSFGTLLAGGVIAAVNTKLPGMHKTIWQIGDPPPKGQQQTWLNSWSGLGHAIAAIWDRVRHALAATWDTVWNNTIGRTERGMHDIAHEFDTWRHNTASIFDTVRHDIASIWDTVWSNTVGRAQRGIADLNKDIGGLPGKIRGFFSGAGKWLVSAGHDVIQGLWNGMLFIWHKVQSWVSSIAGWIKQHKGPIALDQQLLVPAGKALMSGLHTGLLAGFTQGPLGFIQGLAGTIGDLISRGLSGLWHGGGLSSVQGIAARMLPAFGWGGNQMPALIDLWNRESGWRWNALNQSSGAYGIPQALPASKMASAGPDWRTNPATQILWGLNYIKGRYGSPANAWAHELAAGWYGSGLDAVVSRPTLIGVGERGPERVNVVPLHGTRTSGPTVVNHITVQVGHGTHPVQAAQEIAKVLNAGARNGVKLRGSIIGPG